jgi:hypothetical protein
LTLTLPWGLDTLSISLKILEIYVILGRLAQLVEHQSYKLRVTGSNPVSPTILRLPNGQLPTLLKLRRTRRMAIAIYFMDTNS